VRTRDARTIALRVRRDLQFSHKWVLSWESWSGTLGLGHLVAMLAASSRQSYAVSTTTYAMMCRCTFRCQDVFVYVIVWYRDSLWSW